MASGNDSVPTGAEAERQLERMLAGRRLKTSPNRRMLLEYVVQKCLQNKEISEDIIGCDLFPNYADDESDIVRVTASQLRQTLSRYYASEGIDDLVRIELPPGRRYRPVFSYNPRSDAHKAYMRGLVALSQTRLQNAKLCFERAIRLQPAYAGAHLGFAEAELIMPLCPSDISVARGYRGVALHHHGGGRRVTYARESIAAALNLNPDLWRGHILSGVSHAYEYEWDKAETAFAAALEISPDTRNDPWYLSYLIATNRFDEALPILETKVREAPTDASVLTQYGFLLYVLRKHSEAAEVFEEATTVDPQHWPACIGNACAVLEYVGPDSALSALGDIRDSFPYGLFFPGFVVLCLARFGRSEEAQKSFARFVESGTSSDVDRALAYMGLGRIDEAVKELSLACDDGDPLMLWLHLWPIFDPLRNHKGFKALLKRIGLAKKRPLP